MRQLTNLDEVAHLFKPGSNVVLHSAAAEPPLLVAQITALSPQLKGVNLYPLMPMSEAPYTSADASQLAVRTLLAGQGLRQAVNEGRAAAVRVRVSEIPAIYHSRQLTADVLLLQVSAPNSEGVMSLGISVDYMRAVLEQCPTVVAELNPRMPFTSGDTLLRPEQVDFFIESAGPPLIVEAVESTPIDCQIAQHVAGLIANGAVLQIGIGAIPDRVLGELSHLRDLGVHSGIITDSLLPLLESGVVNNETKKEFRGRCVTPMAIGTQKFYDFLHRNPNIEFQSCALTHDFDTLKEIDGLTTINSVLQIDLAGNANAERLGRKFISSPGGLLDFARGASAARHGCSIVALRSASKDGRQSNILPGLPADCPIIVTERDIDYVVTECGVARLRGLSPERRAEQLIAIAHPDFRQDLRRSLRAPQA